MRNSDLTNGPCHYSIRYRSENWFYFCPALELQMKNTKQQTCELWNESFGLSQLGVRAPLSKWVKNHQLDQWNISYISVFIYIYYIYVYIHSIIYIYNIYTQQRTNICGFLGLNILDPLVFTQSVPNKLASVGFLHATQASILWTIIDAELNA